MAHYVPTYTSIPTIPYNMDRFFAIATLLKVFQGFWVKDSILSLSLSLLCRAPYIRAKIEVNGFTFEELNLPRCQEFEG